MPHAANAGKSLSHSFILFSFLLLPFATQVNFLIAATHPGPSAFGSTRNQGLRSDDVPAGSASSPFVSWAWKPLGNPLLIHPPSVASAL
jgi:hypothetical protein